MPKTEKIVVPCIGLYKDRSEGNIYFTGYLKTHFSTLPSDIPSSRALLPSEDFSLTYIIPALICIPTAFLLYLVYHCRVYEKLQEEKVARMSKIELEQENKPPERVKPFIGLYLVVLFAIASIQQMTVAYGKCCRVNVLYN